MRTYFLLLALPILMCLTVGAQAQDNGVTAAGITFKTLPDKDLDMFKEKTGFRFGVLVAAVQAGSPAAAAGVKPNDLVFAVGETGIDSAEQAAAEINALTGEITLTGATMKGQNYEGKVYKLQAGAKQPDAPQPNGAPAAATRAEALGLIFETLSAKDLDTLKANTGYRLGVQIVEVKPGSPGAAAGLKATDLLLAVGKTGVDSAEKAVAALQAAAGQVDLGTLTLENGTFAAKIRKLTIPARAVGETPAPPQGQAQGANEGLVNKPTQDPIEAYFDMMDFIRSQAWGRQVSTSEPERQRVATQLQTTQLDQQSAAVLLQIPQGWAAVQNKWKSWNDAQKSKQRAEWHTQLLLPGNLYPSPANPQQFTAPQGLGVAFQYPGEWTGGWTEANKMPLVFLGPGGQQAQWEQVLDTPNSPPGALFALATITNDMKGMSYLQAAHYVAQLLIPSGLQNLKVIQELPIGEVGAVITLTGKFPGQSEDKFYWMGVIKFGDSQVLAGRMGGSVKDAETLIPAFTYMLQTLQLSPPRAAAGGGGGVSGAWDAAWSRVDVAITKNIWAPSGN